MHVDEPLVRARCDELLQQRVLADAPAQPSSRRSYVLLCTPRLPVKHPEPPGVASAPGASIVDRIGSSDGVRPAAAVDGSDSAVPALSRRASSSGLPGDLPAGHAGSLSRCISAQMLPVRETTAHVSAPSQPLLSSRAASLRGYQLGPALTLAPASRMPRVCRQPAPTARDRLSRWLRPPASRPRSSHAAATSYASPSGRDVRRKETLTPVWFSVVLGSVVRPSARPAGRRAARSARPDAAARRARLRTHAGARPTAAAALAIYLSLPAARPPRARARRSKRSPPAAAFRAQMAERVGSVLALETAIAHRLLAHPSIGWNETCAAAAAAAPPPLAVGTAQYAFAGTSASVGRTATPQRCVTRSACPCRWQKGLCAARRSARSVASLPRCSRRAPSTGSARSAGRGT